MAINYELLLATARMAEVEYHAALKAIEDATLPYLAEHGIAPGWEYEGSLNYSNPRKWVMGETVAALHWQKIEPRVMFFALKKDGSRSERISPHYAPVVEILKWAAGR